MKKNRPPGLLRVLFSVVDGGFVYCPLSEGGIRAPGYAGVRGEPQEMPDQGSHLPAGHCSPGLQAVCHRRAARLSIDRRYIMIYYVSKKAVQEVFTMAAEGTLYTTKPFMSGRSQAIRIPKELRLDDTEVVINRVGESLMITPREALERMFFSGIDMFTDDFLADGRPEETPNGEVVL